jgi:hypothetical protein
MQHLDLSDEEAAALIKEHHKTRVRRLRGFLAKLRPERAREPLLPPQINTPPRAKATAASYTSEA